MKRETPDPNRLYTSELAPLLLVTERSVRLWCEKMGMPHQATAGGHLRFKAKDVVDWMVRSDMPVPDALRRLAAAAAA